MFHRAHAVFRGTGCNHPDSPVDTEPRSWSLSSVHSAKPPNDTVWYYKDRNPVRSRHLRNLVHPPVPSKYFGRSAELSMPDVTNGIPVNGVSRISRRP